VQLSINHLLKNKKDILFETITSS
jgi:hypothetical protein